MDIPDANTTLWPLTASQMEVWDAQMRSPHSPFFNHAEYFDITGPISPVLFEQALLHMVAETECLTIRLVETAEGPLQAIGPDPRWELPVIDMSSSPEPQSAAELWMCQDVDRVFDLTHELLFRYGLLRPEDFGNEPLDALTVLEMIQRAGRAIPGLGTEQVERMSHVMQHYDVGESYGV